MFTIWKIAYSSTILFLCVIIGLSTYVVSSQVLFEYFSSSPKSTDDILIETITNEDYEKKIKLLPDGKNIVYQLHFGQEIRLLYPVIKPGPFRISISPCFGTMKWVIAWRPYSPEPLEILQSQQLRTNIIPGGHNFSVNDEPFVLKDERGQNGKKSSQEEDKYSKNERRKKLKILKEVRRASKHRYGSHVSKMNFSSYEMKRPKINYVYQDDKPIREFELAFGWGDNPWYYQKEVVQPGLYLLKVQSLNQHSKFHALATKHLKDSSQQESEIRSFNVKEQANKHSVTLTWNQRTTGESLICLVVSQFKFYSSLCGARDLQRTSRDSPSFPNSIDKSLILGCTSKAHYSFPVTPEAMYYVSLWETSSLIPILQATVRAKPNIKTFRLKSGVMVPFTLTAGGHVMAKFNVRKAGRKLHVAAVSCSGGVQVQVMAGKERVAAAKGREALHLAVQHVPKAKLTIKVSPVPPLESLYRVHLVASHSARKLPIPRLPKNVTVMAIPINCTTAKIKWFRSPGGATYCVLLQRHPSGRPPEIRPPIQCGWEHVIKRHDYFNVMQCYTGNKGRKQTQTVSVLEHGASFLVNVLVRHPLTGKTLALAPAMLNLPPCSRETNETFLDET